MRVLQDWHERFAAAMLLRFAVRTQRKRLFFICSVVALSHLTKTGSGQNQVRLGTKHTTEGTL